MKKTLILSLMAFALTAGAQAVKTDWQIEREILEDSFSLSQATVDRIDHIRLRETVADCILRLALDGYPHVYTMIEEAQAQYGSPLFFELFGKELGFINAFDAEAKIKSRYPSWVKARGLDLTINN